MTWKFKYTWILTAFITDVLKSVKVQFPMPIFPGPPPSPIFPMPMPALAPALFPMAIFRNNNNMLASTTTTTTTTTKKPETVGIAIPMPMPMPMPIPCMAMPMGVPMVPPPQPAPHNVYQKPPPRPNNCPPCPPCVCQPSCTPPAFSYCSPCHLKCRCRNKEDVPEPLPHRLPQGPGFGIAVAIPVMPPPVVVVPYARPTSILSKPRKERKVRYSSGSDESNESSSSESDYKRKRRYKRRRKGVHRRSLRSSNSENELVQPMLSYVAENGDIKFKTKISSDDVAELLGEKKFIEENQAVPVLLSEDDNSPKVIVVKNNAGKQKREKYKKVLLREGVADHVLRDGKKEIVFRPRGNKKISNLTVSFQIS